MCMYTLIWNCILSNDKVAFTCTGQFASVPIIYLLLQHPLEKTKDMMLFALHCPHGEIEASTDKALTEEYAYDDDKRGIQNFGLPACLILSHFASWHIFFSQSRKTTNVFSELVIYKVNKGQMRLNCSSGTE